MFDFLTGLAANPMDYKGNLERANYAVQDKLGKFLSSGQRIVTLRDQAKAFTSSQSSAAKAKAQALVLQGDSLLNGLRGVQTRAMSLLSQAADFRLKMDTDPFWKNIIASPLDNLGYETLKRAKAVFSEVTTLISSMYAINKEMDAHMRQVDAYASDVGSLSGVAQGKGIAGIGRVFSGLAEKQMTYFAVSGVAVALYWVYANRRRGGK